MNLSTYVAEPEEKPTPSLRDWISAMADRIWLEDADVGPWPELDDPDGTGH